MNGCRKWTVVASPAILIPEMPWQVTLFVISCQPSWDVSPSLSLDTSHEYIYIYWRLPLFLLLLWMRHASWTALQILQTILVERLPAEFWERKILVITVLKMGPPKCNIYFIFWRIYLDPCQKQQYFLFSRFLSNKGLILLSRGLSCLLNMLATYTRLILLLVTNRRVDWRCKQINLYLAKQRQ